MTNIGCPLCSDLARLFLWKGWNPPVDLVKVVTIAKLLTGWNLGGSIFRQYFENIAMEVVTFLQAFRNSSSLFTTTHVSIEARQRKGGILEILSMGLEEFTWTLLLWDDVTRRVGKHPKTGFWTFERSSETTRTVACTIGWLLNLQVILSQTCWVLIIQHVWDGDMQKDTLDGSCSSYAIGCFGLNYVG